MDKAKEVAEQWLEDYLQQKRLKVIPALRWAWWHRNLPELVEGRERLTEMLAAYAASERSHLLHDLANKLETEVRLQEPSVLGPIVSQLIRSEFAAWLREQVLTLGLRSKATY